MSSQANFSDYGLPGEDESRPCSPMDWTYASIPASQPRPVFDSYDYGPPHIPTPARQKSRPSGSTASRDRSRPTAVAANFHLSRHSHASQDQKARSHISVSSDDPGNSDSERRIAELEQQIAKLEKRCLAADTRAENIVYVSILPHHANRAHMTLVVHTLGYSKALAKI